MIHDNLIKKQYFKDEGTYPHLKSSLGICFVFYCVSIIIISAKLLETIIAPSWIYENLTNYNPSNYRGIIKDRNNIIIATNIPTFNLQLNCKLCIDSLELYKNVAKTFGTKLSQNQIQKIVSKRGFVTIKKHITPKQKQYILQQGISGVEFLTRHKRFYPYSKATSHLVGYVNHKNQGISGLEFDFNNYLKHGNKNLHSTIDIKVQSAVYSILAAGMQKYKYLAASAIVIECDSAEIIAMVNFPSFDPHNIVSSSSKEMFNHASSGLYESGSSLKVFNTALALEKTNITLNTKFDVSRPIIIDSKFKINDLSPKTGELNVADVFRFSSNIGSTKMAFQAGREKQQSFLRKIGLLNQCFIAGVPNIPHPKYPQQWSKTNVATISFGYAYAASALQLITSFNAVINNGIYKTLSIIKNPATTTLKKQPRALNQTTSNVYEKCNYNPNNEAKYENLSIKKPGQEKRVISAATSAKLRALMHYTVTSGSARKAWLANYYIGGKTGSSNVLEHNGIYNKNKTNSNFIAFIGHKLNKPKYLVFVQLIEPQRIKETKGYNTAGWNASVLGRKILANVANITGLPPNFNVKKRSIYEITKIA